MIEKVRPEKDSEEAKALVKGVDAAVEESLEYVKKHGGKSSEGFFRSDKGPRGIDVE